MVRINSFAIDTEINTQAFFGSLNGGHEIKSILLNPDENWYSGVFEVSDYELTLLILSKMSKINIPVVINLKPYIIEI